MSETADQLKLRQSRNEVRAQLCGIAVVVGLLFEVWLAYEFPHGKSPIENWGPVATDALIALGVFGEILFDRRALKLAAKLQIIAEAAAAESNTRSIDAIARAAEAEKESIQLRLELAKLKQPRDVDFAAFNRAMTGIAPGSIEIEYGSGTDSPWLANRLMVAFGSLGWRFPDGIAGLPHPVKPDDSMLCKLVSPIECMGGQQFGVTVVVPSPTSKGDETTRAALMTAVGIGIGAVGMFGGEHPSVPIGTVRILIGARS